MDVDDDAFGFGSSPIILSVFSPYNSVDTTGEKQRIINTYTIPGENTPPTIQLCTTRKHYVLILCVTEGAEALAVYS